MTSKLPCTNYYPSGDGDDLTIPDMLSLLLTGKPILRAGPGAAVEEPTVLYRIEMPNGHGPYNSGLPNQEQIYEKICGGGPGWDCAKLAGPEFNNEQMGLTEDDFRTAHGDCFYACESLDAIGSWFPTPARVYLKTLGAIVVAYEVPAGAPVAAVGHGEVLFSKAVSKLHARLDAETFEEIVP